MKCWMATLHDGSETATCVLTALNKHSDGRYKETQRRCPCDDNLDDSPRHVASPIRVFIGTVGGHDSLVWSTASLFFESLLSSFNVLVGSTGRFLFGRLFLVKLRLLLEEAP
ncbi:hypothetical protein PIB30_023693 [Stylosanthes scabra]|uniref:Uncharacterized protein n=1 Tax=Stylosanthes scabra TaxID=79078 RepID=A0ABU6UA04_9FABA|nr:hypothetical protein [Stylosanthes scabra]